jgi:DNA-binding CsgD family transcriptional regulator
VEARVLDLVGDVQGLLDLDEFRESLIVALKRMVPSDWVSLNDIGPTPDDYFTLIVPPMTQEQVEQFAALAHENPLIRYYQETQDGRTYRLSDVCTTAEFHATRIYRDFYRAIGMEYQMAFTLPAEPGRLLGVALSRREADFTDGERQVLDRARPFLIQQYRNATEFTDARDAAARAQGGALVEALRSAGLTEREAAVMRLIALGRSNADAAHALEVSVRTVQKHVERAFAKLGVNNRSEAAARAWELSR